MYGPELRRNIEECVLSIRVGLANARQRRLGKGETPPRDTKAMDNTEEDDKAFPSSE